MAVPPRFESHTSSGFVGRERELGQLLAGLDETLEGRGRLFLVGGEPGIGKSRLADELAARARELGVRVLWGRCWEAGGAPAYWPWVQALRAYVRDEEPEALAAQLASGAWELAQIVPEVRDVLGEMQPPAAVDPEGARFRLFDATACFLRNAAGSRPLLIVLDDLNAADTPSLLLLQFVAAELAESRLMLVCAYRDVEVGPGHPIVATLRELVRVRGTRRLEVMGLPEADVGRLVELIAGVTPPGPVAATLYRETEGNPLFVGEVVRLLVEEGRLEHVGELAWRLAIPESVRGVIGRRLERLSGECKRVLALASALGRDFSLEALARLSGLDTDKLLEILDEAIAARVVAEAPGGLGRMRFAHGLTRETLYDELPALRRLRLHRRIGEVLESLYASDREPHLAELAHHFFQAVPVGDRAKAVGYARGAGDRAARLFAYEEAVRLYEMALEALEESADERERCELLLALGNAQARAGELGAAQDTFAAAASLANKLALPEHLARAATGYMGRYTWVRAGDDTRLIPLLGDALAALPEEDSALRVRLLARLACARRSEPDPEPRAALARQAVEMARRLGDTATLADALDGLFGARWLADNMDEQLALAEQLAELARESKDKERIAHAHLARLAVMLPLGRIVEAEEALDRLARIADEIRQPSQQWMAAVGRAFLALFRGEFEPAERLMEEELRIGQSAVGTQAEVAFASHTIWLRKEQGRPEEVEPTARRAAAEYSWYPIFRCFLAELYAELEREQEARHIFEQLAADEFGQLPRDNEWLLGASVLADVCAYLGDVDRARILYDQLLPLAHLNVVGLAELCRGSAARSVGVLAAAIARYQEAQEHFEAACAANERMGAWPWVARTQYDHARMLLACDRPGDRDRARALLTTALATARSLGMVALAARIEQQGGQPPPRVTTTASVFRLEGEYWTVVFEGDAFRVKDSKGLRYLARLLAAPGKELHALALVGAEQADARAVVPVEEGLSIGGLGDAGEVIDAQAQVAYRQRIADLREEIEEAEAWNDPERAAQAREEMEFIAHELSAAVGLGGRRRRAASAAERARVNATRAIKAALARLGEHSPALAAHLEHTVRTGTFCSYTPDARLPTAWQL